MSYQVFLAHEAEKVLARVDRSLQRRIHARLLQLSQDPFDPRLSSPLTERPGVRKSRVGGWRILFAVDREETIVFVAAIDTRGQVYKHGS